MFSLPLAVLFYFNIAQLSEKMEFARGELAGNQFQRPAVRLVKALCDYQSAAVAAPRNASNIEAAKQAVDGFVRQLESENKELASNLGFTDQALKEAGLENLRVSEISQKWTALQATSQDPSSKAASDQFDQLVGDVRGLIGHAGDTSNLTLDPEMDSYYLADVTSVTGAQTLNRIGSAALLIEPLLRSPNLVASTRTALAVYSAMLKESDFDRITGDLDTALKENGKSPRGPSPTLKGAVGPAVANYKEDVQSLMTLLAASGQGKPVGADEFRRASARASEASLNVWDKTITELDAVLRMRIDGFARYRLIIIGGTGLSLGVALVVFVFTVRSVTQPLIAAVAHVENVARGDLSKEIPASYLARKDEIGTLSRAMREMSTQLREMILEISSGVGVLSAAASLMQASSTTMTSGSKHTSDKAHSVAAAAEQMSSNVTSAAAGMEQTTTNLANVAAATDEMTATITEIAGNSERARGVMDQATIQAQRITDQISELSESAQGIGKISEAINEICSQTNLLALNATIEAARAGAAGKGFAVVASEIKTLAKQTGAATEDIKTRISGVQRSTANGIAEIEKVTKVIHEVSAIVSSIAAAIEEQATTSKEIARNIAEASLGVTNANDRVSQTSQVSQEISRDIIAVHLAASEMADGSSHVRSSALEVSRICSQLMVTVEGFKV